MNKGDIEIQVQIPAGDYFLGDPCYTIRDEDWVPWLEACNYKEEDNLVGKIPGTNFSAVGFRTAWGDGVYPLQHAKRGSYADGWVDYAELGVDAGLIGFVPCEYGGEVSMYVTKITFDSLTSVTWREGNFEWTNSNGEKMRVVTDGSDEDEYY
jgi:hypothetical protein